VVNEFTLALRHIALGYKARDRGSGAIKPDNTRPLIRLVDRQALA